MPIYKYFGAPAKYHGKPLFHILANLKEFGKGRIVSRAGFKDENPSFYRVLFAQPLMDSKSEEGRVIVEKVRNGVKYTDPVDLSNIASIPDFILISRNQEEAFCKWSELRDYSAEKDVVVEPKHFTMPPLLRLLMEREMTKRGEDLAKDKFLLPHFKTYMRKDRDVLEDGKEEKYQETVTRCEGTASYNYVDSILPEYSYGVLEPEGASKVLKRLPEEEPFPKPEIGMRLTKLPWNDMVKRNKEEARTN